MRKSLLLAVVVAIVLFAGFLITREGDTPTDAATAAVGGGGRAGSRSTARPPMLVEFATARRAALTERVLAVGSLIGAATVQAMPKINGRLPTVYTIFEEGWKGLRSGLPMHS